MVGAGLGAYRRRRSASASMKAVGTLGLSMMADGTERKVNWNSFDAGVARVSWVGQTCNVIPLFSLFKSKRKRHLL